MMRTISVRPFRTMTSINLLETNPNPMASKRVYDMKDGGDALKCWLLLQLTGSVAN